MRSKLMFCAAAFALLPLMSHSQEEMPATAEIAAEETAPQTTLSVENAYAFPPIGAGKVGVAFMRIDNAGETAYQLKAASSDAFGRIELHTHLYEDGLMKMREVEAIDVPAGQSAELKPGGLHLMLFEPVGEIKVGDAIGLQLTFVEAQTNHEHTETIEIPVKARSAAAATKAKPHSAHEH